MLRTIIWLIRFFLDLITRAPRYWKAKRIGRQGLMEEQRAMVQHEVKTWASALLAKTGITLVVEGCENLPPHGEAVAFAVNHQSYLDIPIILAGLDTPRALLSKREIGKIPVLGGWMRLLGCVFVQREDARSAIAVLRACEEKLAGGESIIIFPEGTRSKSDNMGEFKAGVVRMAAKAGVRIVPIAIDGSYKVLEGNNYRLSKAHVRMIILPPIPTEGLTRQEQKALPTQLENAIRQAKDKRT